MWTNPSYILWYEPGINKPSLSRIQFELKCARVTRYMIVGTNEAVPFARNKRTYVYFSHYLNDIVIISRPMGHSTNGHSEHRTFET